MTEDQSMPRGAQAADRPRNGLPVTDIAIFAHNEADGIGRMIEELGRQDLLQRDDADLRVLVLANGCTDDTARIARETAAALPGRAAARIEVMDLAQGGKSRTVNRFIHEFSRPEAELLGFMDADIRMPRSDTLSRMLSVMVARPELHVFTSRPVKDVIHDRLDVGFAARMIAMAGDGLSNWRKSICGQLFVMRALTARRMALPAGLPVEDGFMRAMMLTDLLSAPEDLSRIDGDPEVFHVYESIRGIGELIRHQTRIVIGSAVNAAIYARIRNESTTEAESNALLMTASVDESWLDKTLRNALPKAPYGYVPFEFMTKRLRRWRSATGPSRGLKSWMILVVGLGLDVFVWVRASLRMAFRSSAGFW